MKITDTIAKIAKRSTNNGVQITTYTDGRTQVHWLEDGGLCEITGPTLVGTLERAADFVLPPKEDTDA